MMEYSLEVLVTSCVLKSIFDLEIINSKSQDISFLAEMYGGVNQDVFMISKGKAQNRLADILRFVDDKYLEKNLGYIAPLSSPFGCGDYEVFAYNPSHSLFSEIFSYPQDTVQNADFDIEKFLQKCRKLCAMYTGETLLYSLLDALENDCSFISLSGGRQSLFETAKLRAGIATCVWFNANNSTTELSSKNEYILVCSLDFLGIKDFKFQKSNTCDIKSEVLSSLYIDLFRENVLDDLFDDLGISRCNLIFSGGRHLHTFLPNTVEVKEIIAKNMKRVNNWLVKMFKLDLYVSYGMASLQELAIDMKREEDFFEKIFISIASQKAVIEARKYSIENIIDMNSMNITEIDFHNFSERFYGAVGYLVTEENNEGIPIGPNRYISPIVSSVGVGNYIRMYIRKIEFDIVPSKSISIWAQDVTNDNIDLSKCEKNQYGVLRFDIDDFKKFMLRIFTQDKITNSPTYKMELSKHFAIFLRRDLHIMIRRYAESGKKIYCVHEGADDAFIFAEIKNLLQFTTDLIRHYKRFTLNKISFSAGLSMYNCDHNFSDNANLAQKLMDKAKTIQNKDGIAIWDENHVMKWEDFFNYARNSEDMV